MSRLKEVSTRGKVPGMMKVDEEQVRGHLDLMVKTTVEQALNSFLEIEAKELCGAGRYERSPDRMDTRAGSYRRKLHTRSNFRNMG